MRVGTSTAAMHIYAPNVVMARIQQLSAQLDMDVRHPQRRVSHDLNGLLHYLLLLLMYAGTMLAKRSLSYTVTHKH